MRQKIVAANWKMNGDRAFIEAFCLALSRVTFSESVATVIFPPFVFLPEVQTLLQNTSITWGAQNVSSFEKGAYTGEISADMLKAFGCRYVLVGHSERRHLFHETNELVVSKFMRVKSAGLIPMLCLGETLAEREAGQTEKIIQNQLDAILSLAGGVDLLNNSALAYEPVWAIGTGKTATPEQAEAVHAFIRAYIAEKNKALSKTLSILYGGSVKASNAKELFAMPNIDGGLIGGASLDIEEFVKICLCIH